MPEEGGYCCIFADNDCLVCNGLFVWTDRTMMKLGESTEGNNIKEKQTRLALYKWSSSRGKNAIIDGVPFKQYLGPMQLQR